MFVDAGKGVTTDFLFQDVNSVLLVKHVSRVMLYKAAVLIGKMR